MRDEHSHIDWRAAAHASLANRELDPASAADVAEELAQHLEAAFDALIARGVPPDDARAELLDGLSDGRLGEAVHSRAPYRATPAPGAPARRAFIDMLWQDFRYGWRALVRTPAVSIVAVLSLALTMGANTAVFGLLDTVLLEPLPASHPEQLFAMERQMAPGLPAHAIPMSTGKPLLMSLASYRLLRQAPGLSQVQAFTSRRVSIKTASAAVPEGSLDLVSGGFFRFLGVPLAVGRGFTPLEASSGAAVGIASYDFWKRRMNAAPDAIGQVVHVNGAPVTIIGITGSRYHGLQFGQSFDIAVPLGAAPLFGLQSSQALGVTLLARATDPARRDALAKDVSTALGTCCLAGVQDWGTHTGMLVQALDASHGAHVSRVREEYHQILVVLMGGVLVLLLLGCANVATLLLARGTARIHEFAVRASLGATRPRIARQLLVESLELTLAGTVVGLALARLATQLLTHALPAAAAGLTDQVPLHASARIALFTTGAVLVSTLICGVIPAMRISRADLRAALSGTQRSARRGAWTILDRGLVTTQIALSLVLVSVAMLFVATMRSFQDFPFGYRDDRIVLAGFDVGHSLEHPASLLKFSERLRDRVASVPGVDRVATASNAPLFGRSRVMASIIAEGTPTQSPAPFADITFVSPGYFEATGIDVQRGRGFAAIDSTPDSPVVIVSTSLARKLFGAADPIGRRVQGGLLGIGKIWGRIVGVAGDAYYPHLSRNFSDDVATPSDMLYLPLAQVFARDTEPLRHFELEAIVHTTRDPRAVEHALSRQFAALPDAQLSRMQTVTQALDAEIPRERLAAIFGTIFAIIAVGLAAAGLFGVVAYAVVRRTREIGIRIALGARPGHALWLMIREMLALTGIGAVAGVVLGREAGNAVRSQLYGISASDPRVLLAAALLLLLVGLIASALPALRATRVDPLIALRSE